MSNDGTEVVKYVNSDCESRVKDSNISYIMPIDGKTRSLVYYCFNIQE